MRGQSDPDQLLPNPWAVATVTVRQDWTASVDYVATWQTPPSGPLHINMRAPGLSQLTATGSPGLEVTALAWRGRANVVVRPQAEGPVSLQLRYALRLTPFEGGNAYLLSLSRTAFPRLASLGGEPKARPPWCAQPDLVVDIADTASDVQLLGSRYRHAPDSPGNRFGFYDHAPAAPILVGTLTTHRNGPPVAVLCAGADGDPEMAALCEIVFDEATRILAFLRREYGEPAVALDSIVLAQAGDHPSLSLGSSIFLNVRRVLQHPTVEERRYHVGGMLAHEFAHSWWAYSALWHDLRFSNGADEMIAALLELITAHAVGGTNRTRIAAKWGIWAKFEGALERSEAHLRRTGCSDSGVWAAAVLQGVMRHRIERVRLVLRDLWDTSHHTLLQRHHLRDALDARIGLPAGEATIEALDRPKPVLATLRVEKPSKRSGWKLLIRVRSDRAQVLRRLKVARPSVGTVREERNEIVIDLHSLHELQTAAVELQPACFFSRREARALFLTKTDLKSRMWRWAIAVLQNQDGDALQGRIVAVLVCLVLNPDHPAGFWGLARLKLPRGLRRLFQRAAFERCIYAADDQYSSN